MKASRVPKPETPQKKSFDSEGWKRFSFVVRDSLKELRGDVAAFLVLAALGAAAWLSFQGTKPAKEEAPPELPVASKSAPLVDALEKYHAEKGIYPKTMRESGLARPVSGVIYRGGERELVLTEDCAAAPFSDPCWKGYRRYQLLAEDGGKEYVYSSDTRTWKEV